jgi:hypothetical protein
MRCAVIVAALVAAGALVSCLSVDTAFSINENGGGQLVFQYRISQMFKNLDKTEGDAELKNAPLPLTEADVRRALAKNPGVSVVSVRQWEDDTDVYVKGEITFKTVAALNQSDLFADMPVSLVKENGQTVFTQMITDKREPLDQETLDAYQGLMEGYTITITVKPPRPILTASRGQLSADKRILTYTISLADFMRLTERTELRISW